MVINKLSTKQAIRTIGNMDLNVFEIGGMECLCVLLLAFWIIYLYFVKDYGYWEEREVPHIPAIFPCGSLWDTVLGTAYWGATFQNVYRDYEEEPYVGFTSVRKPCLLIKDPELVRLILEKNFDHFTDHHWFELNPKDYMMRNLFNMKGQEWKKMRMKLTPAYTAAKVKMMFCSVKKNSDIMREVLDKKVEQSEVVNIKEVLNRFSMDVFVTCAFGLDMNSLLVKHPEFYEVCKRPFHLTFKSLLKMYIYNAFPVFTKVHCFDFLDQKLQDLLTGVIRSTVECRERFSINRNDFLDLMIKLKQNQCILECGGKSTHLNGSSRPGKKEGLTIEDIIAQTFLFFSAGYETTSNTALFCLYELACNSSVQEKLHREVKEVIDRHHGTFSYQALEEMTYMEQVVNESMRRYPVIPQVIRNCTQDYKIPNSTLVIEKGIRVVIPVYAFHHDPKHFPDPYTFNPERFSEQNCKGRQPFVFLPFGAGPRMCIGFRFGMMKVKTAVASLVLDYQISPTPDTQTPLKFKGNSFTTVPSRELRLIFKRRHQDHTI